MDTASVDATAHPTLYLENVCEVWACVHSVIIIDDSGSGYADEQHKYSTLLLSTCVMFVLVYNFLTLRLTIWSRLLRRQWSMVWFCLFFFLICFCFFFLRAQRIVLCSTFVRFCAPKECSTSFVTSPNIPRMASYGFGASTIFAHTIDTNLLRFTLSKFSVLEMKTEYCQIICIKCIIQ